MRAASGMSRLLAGGAATTMVLLLVAAGPGREEAGGQAGKGEESKPLARYFPRTDLVVYAEFDGLRAHGEAWRRTAAAKILGETTTGAMLKQLAIRLTDRILSEQPGERRLRGEELWAVAEHALEHGFAFGIVRHPGDRKPSLVGFVIRDAAGGPARRVLGKLIDAAGAPGSGSEPLTKPGDRRVLVVGGARGGGFAWWSEGADLAFSFVDPSGADLMIEALDGREADATTHPTRAELALSEGGFEPIGLAFFDMAALPEMPPGAASLGLDRIRRLDYRWGVQAEALVTLTRLVAPAPRSGLLALLDQPTFRVEELPPLPAGLAGFTAFSVDPGKLYGQVRQLLETGDPRSIERLQDIEQNVRDATGRDLREDVLGALGPKMVFYGVPTKINAPTNPIEGFLRGLVHVPQSTLLIQVDDAERFGSTLDALLMELNKDLEILSEQMRAQSAPSPFQEIRKDASFIEVPAAPVFSIEPAPGAPVEKKAVEPSEPRAFVEPVAGAVIGTVRPPQDEDRRRPVPAFRRLEGDRPGYILDVPPSIFPLPAGMRPTLLLGRKHLAISSTPEAARAALDLEGRTSGLPEGDPLAPALDGLPEGLLFLAVDDARQSMLPEAIANLPNIVEMALSGSFAESIMPPPMRFFFARAGMRPGFGRGFDLGLDPHLIPTPEAIRQHLFPASYVLSVDDRGFTITTREAFPSLNPAALAPIALAAAVPAVQSARVAAMRSQSTNNLKQIGLALHNFHDVNGHFPSDIKDQDGKPLLSWRVAILPFVEGAPLFNQFHLDEPWDSPHNKALLESMPMTYRIPNSPAEPGLTFYRGFSGPHTLFDPEVPGGISLSTVTDGTSNTIGVVEAREAVPWTKPDTGIPFELDLEPGQQAQQGQQILEQLGGHFPGGFNALFLDGSVRFIRETVSPLVLRALISRDGGEVVSADSF